MNIKQGGEKHNRQFTKTNLTQEMSMEKKNPTNQSSQE